MEISRHFRRKGRKETIRHASWMLELENIQRREKKMVGLTLPLKMLEAKQLGKLSKPAFCGRTEGKPRGSARY